MALDGEHSANDNPIPCDMRDICTKGECESVCKECKDELREIIPEMPVDFEKNLAKEFRNIFGVTNG